MAAHYNGIIGFIWKKVSHFDYDKYWKMREYVISHQKGIKTLYYLYRVKKTDAFHNASLGLHLGFNSAKFASRPYLPHGLNGIIVSNDAIIGKNCQLYHQVTIGGGKNGSPIIGDNVLIGAGAKIIGHVKIGNNVKIGAGCVVAVDVPDNATVVMNKPRIIIHKDSHESITDKCCI